MVTQQNTRINTSIDGDSNNSIIDEWKNLETIIQTKIIPLCNLRGYNKDVVLSDYFEYYSKLNFNYNIITNPNANNDIVSSDIAILNQNLALEYIENNYRPCSLLFLMVN